MKISSAAITLLSSLAILLPYAFHQINWYGRTLWDGLVAIAGGSLQGSIPLWFIFMMAAPIVSFLCAIIGLFRFSGSMRFCILAAIVALFLFPLGTFAGLASLGLLARWQNKDLENKSSHSTANRA